MIEIQRANLIMKTSQSSYGFKFRPRAAALPVLVAVMATGVSSAEPTNGLPATIDRDFLEKLVNRVNADESELKSLKTEMAVRDGATPANTAPQFPNLQFHGFADIELLVLAE